MKLEKLKTRDTKSQSRNKIATAIDLYEKYVDEKINNINIYSSTYYCINDKWNVNISDNTVSRCYSDPE